MREIGGTKVKIRPWRQLLCRQAHSNSDIKVNMSHTTHWLLTGAPECKVPTLAALVWITQILVLNYIDCLTAINGLKPGLKQL